MDSIELLRNNVLTSVRQAKEQGKITEEQYEQLLFLPLGDLDEIQKGYWNLNYCILVNRISKGEEIIEKEEDLGKKTQYIGLLKQLTVELEGMQHVN